MNYHDGLMESFRLRQFDRMYQALWNNIYDNNPGELDRWGSEGGLIPDDERQLGNTRQLSAYR